MGWALCMALVCGLVGGWGCSDAAQCPDTPCGGSERCVDGECVALISLVCFPECDAGQTCSQGTCVGVEGACAQAGQLCDAAQPRSNGFFCVDWDGANFAEPAACEAPCASDGSCEAGSACFLLRYGVSRACFSASDCDSGELCQSGECRPAACKRSECDGFWDGREACEARYGGLPQFERGATCVELSNEVNFCFPAGARAQGERCISASDAATRSSFEDACAPGLGCVQGSCELACRLDTDCAEGGVCLFADKDQVARGVGFCGQPCAPFSTGTCGERRKCLPLDEGRGYCVPAGTLAPGMSCIPGMWGCEEGTICADYGPLGGDGGARCQPMCDIHAAPGDANIPRVDQARRDATCPQVEPPARASLVLTHLAPLSGDVDLYLDGAVVVEGAALGGREPAQGWRNVATGSHTLAARRAGASEQDAPLVERVFTVRRDEGQRVALVDSASGAALVLSNAEPAGATSAASLITLAVSDVPRVDLVVVGASGEEIARLGALEPGGSLESAALPAGDVTLALVPPGAPASDALAQVTLPGAAGPQVFYLVGTLNPDDLAALEVRRWPREAPELALADSLSWTCTTIGVQGYGICEQQCRDAGELGKCQGEQIGCQPVSRNSVVGSEVLCRPVQAQGEVESACDPYVETGACAEGLSCVLFGAGQSGGAAGPLGGRCVEQCVEGDQSCGGGRTCVLADASLFLGRCEWSCMPSRAYADVISCPDGLQTCEPRSRVVESELGASQVEEVAPLCSASGGRALGETCSSGECIPGAECLYPRSRQLGLGSGLLSPYLGGAGLVPTCRAQCDPFDARRSDTICGLGETCLPNYPFNADVGHCAPIVETAGPFQACQRPGESCGADSVCVTDSGAPFCLKLCQFAGGTSAESFAQGTCASGEECAPLVENIGFCRTRGG
jgi:hypothetical protein